MFAHNWLRSFVILWNCDKKSIIVDKKRNKLDMSVQCSSRRSFVALKCVLINYPRRARLTQSGRAAINLVSSCVKVINDYAISNDLL